eukprot:scaffold20822_cov52-Attheya_sp.AAC.3
MQKRQVDIFGFAETNVNWTPKLSNQAYQHGRGRFEHFKPVSSSSDDPTTGFRQPGRTFMATTGKFVGRVSEADTDKYGLGRWCYTCLLGRNDGKLYVVTAYRVSQESNSTGDSTAHKQQVRLLRKRKIENPKPKKQWGEDLVPIIKEWVAQESKVLLMVDANAPLSEVHFSKFMTDTGLFDVLGALHGMDSPCTYNRGSKTIDYILGTEDIIRAVRRGVMLKFKDGIDSDHQGLWIDICILQAFRGDIHEIHRTQARKVNTKQHKRCQKYRTKYSELAKANNILEEVQAFQPDDLTQLTQTEEDELNRLDQAVSDSLILSEKSLPTIPTYWWSETLHIRHQIVKYWKLKLSATRIASNVQDTLTKLEIELADTDLFQGDPERSISGQIRKAYKLRREARNNSFKLRQDYLEKLAEEEATRNNNSTKEKILRSMRRSEAQRRMYKILNQYLKSDDRAGITQIDIPVESPDGNEKFKRITIKELMNEALLPHFRKHFRQAEPTPFNQEPLKSLIGYTAETEFCDKFRQGTADIDGLDVDDDVKKASYTH